jgi:hypothetical protein
MCAFNDFFLLQNLNALNHCSDFNLFKRRLHFNVFYHPSDFLKKRRKVFSHWKMYSWFRYSNWPKGKKKKIFSLWKTYHRLQYSNWPKQVKEKNFSPSERLVMDFDIASDLKKRKNFFLNGRLYHWLQYSNWPKQKRKRFSLIGRRTIDFDIPIDLKRGFASESSTRQYGHFMLKFNISFFFTNRLLMSNWGYEKIFRLLRCSLTEL